MDQLQKLQGKAVTLSYEGMRYTGKLLGADETQIYLQTRSGHVALPLSGVSDVRALPQQKA